MPSLKYANSERTVDFCAAFFVVAVGCESGCVKARQGKARPGAQSGMPAGGELASPLVKVIRPRPRMRSDRPPVRKNAVRPD